MKTLVLCVATLVVAGSGCGSTASPTAPDARQSGLQDNRLVTISGQVYAELGWAEPAIVDAVIEAKQSDGSVNRVLTDEKGFYEVSARPGDVSITASKDGHQSQTRQFMLSKDTVLNFGLDPM